MKGFALSRPTNFLKRIVNGNKFIEHRRSALIVRRLTDNEVLQAPWNLAPNNDNNICWDFRPYLPHFLVVNKSQQKSQKRQFIDLLFLSHWMLKRLQLWRHFTWISLEFSINWSCPKRSKTSNVAQTPKTSSQQFARSKGDLLMDLPGFPSSSHSCPSLSSFCMTTNMFCCSSRRHRNLFELFYSSFHSSLNWSLRDITRWALSSSTEKEAKFNFFLFLPLCSHWK